MLQWEAPRSVTEIRSFLGLVGYCRRFIKGFWKIGLPLTQLTRKIQAFVWDIQCEESFQELNKKLMIAPILILPYAGEPFIVYCDVSKMALGGVLMQDGKLVTYDSWQLKIHKRKYHTHDLELAVMVFVLKVWRHCFYGLRCSMITKV